MNEAELLFTRVLNCGRLELYRNGASYLKPEQARLISQALARRIKGEPLQYILGEADFYGLKFKVNRNVLIPRPETEILVQSVLNYCNEEKIIRRLNILEIGTGSGCICVSLAKFLKRSVFTAVDISQASLAVALNNARINQVEERITFLKADCWPKKIKEQYDLIISNPPYIKSSEMRFLQREIHFEPKIALKAGADGFKFLSRIIREAEGYLRKEGRLYLEIGRGQEEKLKKIVQKGLSFEIIETIKDYCGINRVVVLKKIVKD